MISMALNVRIDNHERKTVKNLSPSVLSRYLHEIFTNETVVFIASSFPAASIYPARG
jgi:hypothetical protein